MKLSEARTLARETANDTGKTTYVYLDKLKSPDKDYDVAYSIPSFGEQEGDPFEPIRKVVVVEQTPILMGTYSGGSGTLRASVDGPTGNSQGE